MSEILDLVILEPVINTVNCDTIEFDAGSSIAIYDISYITKRNIIINTTNRCELRMRAIHAETVTILIREARVDHNDSKINLRIKKSRLNNIKIQNNSSDIPNVEIHIDENFSENYFNFNSNIKIGLIEFKNSDNYSISMCDTNSLIVRNCKNLRDIYGYSDISKSISLFDLPKLSNSEICREISGKDVFLYCDECIFNDPTPLRVKNAFIYIPTHFNIDNIDLLSVSGKLTILASDIIIDKNIQIKTHVQLGSLNHRIELIGFNFTNNSSIYVKSEDPVDMLLGNSFDKYLVPIHGNISSLSVYGFPDLAFIVQTPKKLTSLYIDDCRNLQYVSGDLQLFDISTKEKINKIDTRKFLNSIRLNKDIALDIKNFVNIRSKNCDIMWKSMRVKGNNLPLICMLSHSKDQLTYIERYADKVLDESKY